MTADPWEDHTHRSVMPPTIEPETFGNDDDEQPSTVFVPTHTEANLDRGDEPAFELRQVDDLVVLPVYSSLELLTECAGPGQPYLELRTGVIDGLKTVLDADEVVWDHAIDVALQHHVLVEDEDEEGIE